MIVRATRVIMVNVRLKDTSTMRDGQIIKFFQAIAVLIKNQEHLLLVAIEGVKTIVKAIKTYIRVA